MPGFGEIKQHQEHRLVLLLEEVVTSGIKGKGAKMGEDLLKGRAMKPVLLSLS